MRDGFGTMWYSKGEGVGAWLQVLFKGLFIISRFEVKPRGNANERNKVIQLEFSDGSKQLFTMLNTDSIQKFDVQQVQTTYVIIKILQVYGTINNGGSFNFFGVECKNLSVVKKSSPGSKGLLKAAGVASKEMPPLFIIEKKVVVNVSCKDTFVNAEKFKTTKMDMGSHIIINCNSSCSLTPNIIYGTGKYTKDSAICKAAFHDNKITNAGGKVTY